MNFGERLTACMEKSNISAYKLSKATGISQTMIGYYKTGKNTPTIDKATIIANYLNVSVDYLLGNEEKTPADADVTFDDFTYALYNESKELSDADKEMLLEMARFFKQRLNEEKNNKQ